MNLNLLESPTSNVITLPMGEPEPIVAPDVKAASDKIEMVHQAINKALKDFKLSGATISDIEIAGGLCREAMLALLTPDGYDFADSIALLAKANQVFATASKKLDENKLTQPKLLVLVAKANALVEDAWNALIPDEED